MISSWSCRERGGEGSVSLDRQLAKAVSAVQRSPERLWRCPQCGQTISHAALPHPLVEDVSEGKILMAVHRPCRQHMALYTRG
jgi:hypothetical protein